MRLKTFHPLSYITANHLFALAVVSMVIGHAVHFFGLTIIGDSAGLYRIPDRILAPIFLIAIGYNSGHKLSRFFILGTIFLTLFESLALGFPYGNILLTILIVRYTIEPLAQHMIKQPSSLWGISTILIIAYPLTIPFIEYGTIAYVLAFSGWLSKNARALDLKTVKPAIYFIFAFFAYVVVIQLNFNFSTSILLITSVGASITFFLMYNFHRLLLNSLKSKKKTPLSKITKFLSHKSLEIFLAHIIVFHIIRYIFIK